MSQMNTSTDRNPSPFETKGNPLEVLAASTRHRQETEARSSAEALIRSLPDDLFADHPDVRQLRVLLRIEEHRAKGATSELANQVGSLISTLEGRQKALRASLELTALDNALAADFEFSGAVSVLEEIQRLDMQIKAAQLAYGLLSGRADQGSSGCLRGFEQTFGEREKYFKHRVHHARDALDTRLLNLKRDYARAQAEKLEQPAGDTAETSTAPEGDLHDGA